MFSISTKNPIAYESFDHIYPCGTMYDNNTSLGFIMETENMVSSRPIHVMDLGCSGGQLVADFKARGHKAIGIEGSDFSIIHERANWPTLHNVNLFTADIAKPFEVLFDDKPIKFDIITIWEVLEHIEPKDLDQVFFNITHHLKDDGYMIASIGLGPAPWMGVDIHRTVMTRHEWEQKLLQHFNVNPYGYVYSPREDVRGLSYFVRCYLRR